jgi:hypothetical protein
MRFSCTHQNQKLSLACVRATRIFLVFSLAAFFLNSSDVCVLFCFFREQNRRKRIFKCSSVCLTSSRNVHETKSSRFSMRSFNTYRQFFVIANAIFYWRCIFELFAAFLRSFWLTFHVTFVESFWFVEMKLESSMRSQESLRVFDALTLLIWVHLESN